MQILKKVIVCLMTISILFGTAACVSNHDSRETAELSDFNAPESIIYVINRVDLTDSAYLLVSSLQGITAQNEAKIFIEDGENIVFIEKYLSENSACEIKRVSTFQELISANIDDIQDKGCVLFDDGSNPTVNMAFTVAGMEKWLAVPVSLKNDVEAIGLEIKMDLSLKENDKYVLSYEDIFEKYKNGLNKNLIVHQSTELITLRDYAAASGAFCFYTEESDRSQVSFRQKVFDWANENAIVFGWSSDELSYVKQASKSGVVVIPSDHCSNLSFLSSLRLKEPLNQKNNAEEIIPQQDKHYISLVMSDGDNVQWYETTLPFREHYYDRITAEESYKLTWTAPPMMYKLAPTVLQYVYDMAADKDRFICGVSGMGYINPTKYDEKAIESFVNKSVYAMQQSDLNTITILDNSKNAARLREALEPYAAMSEIKGGLMQIEEKYEALGGEMLFVNHKPFISARKSFWFKSENPDEKISKEWIENFAAQINALPCDIHSTEGYSYINIHPWSTTIEDLNYFVSLLDGHIEIVYADELVDMVSKNVDN